MSTHTHASNTGGNAKAKKTVIGIIAIAAIAVIAFFGTQNRNRNDDANTVTIGAILPLTGKSADLGNGVRVGLETVVHERNADKKTNYKIEYFDTQSEAKNALTGYTKFKTINRIKFFVTTPSDHALILKPEAIKNESLLFCLTPHSELTKDNGQLVFRYTITSLDEVNYQIHYILNAFPAKQKFFYAPNTESGLEYVKYFKEKLSTDLIGTCLYEEDVTTLRNIATANTYKGADCIIIMGSTPGMGFLIKSIREGGYTGPILANAGFNQPTVLASAGDYAKSVSFSDLDFPYQSNQHKRWNDEALATYKSSFSSISYLTYGILRIFDEIYTSGVHTPREIGNALSEAKTYTVKTGDAALEFNARDGGIAPRLRMQTIDDNE